MSASLLHPLDGGAGDDEEHDEHEQVDVAEHERQAIASRLITKSKRTEHKIFSKTAVPTTLIEWNGPHIAQYNAAKLFRHDFLALRGTVFDIRQRFTWVQLFTLFTISFLVAVYQVDAAAKDLNTQETDHWWDHLNSASTMVNNMVIFLLGFYTTTVTTRWWDLRTQTAALHNYVRNIGVMSATYLSNPDAKYVRDTMIRYANLVHALTFKRHNNDDNWQDLVEGGLLSEDEQAALKGAQAPQMTICHWLSTLLVKSLAERLLIMPESAVPILQNMFLGLRDQTSRIETLIDAQLPFPYVHLLTIILKVALFTLAASLGQQAGSLYLRNHPTWIVFLALRLTLMNFFYQGLMELQVILSNPFQTHPAHFPRDKFLRGIEKDTRTVIKHPEVVPFPSSSIPRASDLRMRV